MYNGALVIPESLEDGWDVIAYMPADGSMPMQVADADGNEAGVAAYLEPILSAMA